MSDRRLGTPDRRVAPSAAAPVEHTQPFIPLDRRASDRWHGDYRYADRSDVARPEADRRSRR
jgi:hypothetical protein